MTQGLSSARAQKAAIGNENQSPTATPLLATPPVSASVRRSVRRVRGCAEPLAPALDKGMATCYYCSLLTALTDTAPTDSDVVRDLSSAETDAAMTHVTLFDGAEVANLRGKYLTHFMHTFIYLFVFSSSRCCKPSAQSSS